MIDISVNKLTKNNGFGNILSDISFDINNKERVSIVGDNGCGKTTLIKSIINGNDKIKLGINVKLGYIPQKIVFEKDQIVYDLANYYYQGDESHLRSVLFKFIFYGDSIYKRLFKLSGGEKVR